MYKPVVAGAATTLGTATGAAVLAETGANSVIAIAVGVAVALAAWGVTYSKFARNQSK